MHITRTGTAALLAGTLTAALAGCGSSSTHTAAPAAASPTTAASSGAGGCASVGAKYASLKGQSFVVGTSPGPDNYDAPDPNDPSKVVGIEPDLLTAVSKCLGFSISFSRLDFTGLIPAMQAGHISLIAAGMYASDERAQQINFVEYMKAGEASVVAKGNPKHLTSMDSTCGVTAAEAVGTVENAIFDKQSATCTAGGKPAIKALQLQGNDQAVQAVADGRADIFLTDSGVASYLAQTVQGIQVGFPIPSDYVFGLGIPKTNSTLLNGVEDAMTSLYTSGQLTKMITKWGFSASQVYPPAIKS